MPSNVSTYPFLCGLPPSFLADNLETIVGAYHDDYYINRIVRPTSMLQWIEYHLTKSSFDQEDPPSAYFYNVGDTSKLAARRSLGGAASGGERNHDSEDRSRAVSDRLQIERLLANRDPLTGRMLMDIHDMPDHLTEEEREHPDAQREHMFLGRNPTRPWLLESGELLV